MVGMRMYTTVNSRPTWEFNKFSYAFGWIFIYFFEQKHCEKIYLILHHNKYRMTSIHIHTHTITQMTKIYTL